MSASKHTPGPWRILEGDSVVAVHAVQRAICDTRGTPYWQQFKSEDLANARLIAAAPELFDAIKEMLRWRLPHDRAFTVTEGSRRAFDGLRDALSKARGEA